MTIDAFASHPHYAAHLRGYLDGLPEPLRGELYARKRGCSWGPQPPATWRPEVCMVAGYNDIAPALEANAGRVFHVEHGAGQTYFGDPRSAGASSYAGGRGSRLGKVALFLCAGEAGAQRWREAWPDAAVAAVGCPKLDRYAWEENPPPSTVAITWHVDFDLVPETMGAWGHYRAAMPDVVKRLQAAGVEVLGHAHPKSPGAAMRRWEQLGVEAVDDEAEIFDRAGLLVADYTSMLYEFAALDRPVVVCNGPHYRRDVEHGMRFWSAIPGLQVNEPGDLADAIMANVNLPEAYATTRAEVTAEVYAQPPGTAGQAAADAIMEIL